MVVVRDLKPKFIKRKKKTKGKGEGERDKKRGTEGGRERR